MNIEGLSAAFAPAKRAEPIPYYAQVLDELLRTSSSLVDKIVLMHDMARIEDGDYEFHASPCDMKELLEEIAGSLQSHPAASDRLIAVESKEGRSIVTDRLLLARVVRCMIKNALESEPRGGRVRVGCDAGPGGGLQVWVRNPSVMPLDAQREMFRRSRSTSGDGPGLRTYSMRLLTEAYLKGSMIFRSEPGLGTEVRAFLPADVGVRPRTA